MALVMSIKFNETIIINGNIFITFLEKSGRVVKVIIDAPKDIPIKRKEIDENFGNREQSGAV